MSAPARILITEDNPQGAELLEAFLADTPHVLRVAGNGEEALRPLTEWKPDVVLLDVMMPRLSGFEVCRRPGRPGDPGHRRHHGHRPGPARRHRPGG